MYELLSRNIFCNLGHYQLLELRRGHLFNVWGERLLQLRNRSLCGEHRCFELLRLLDRHVHGGQQLKRVHQLLGWDLPSKYRLDQLHWVRFGDLSDNNGRLTSV